MTEELRFQLALGPREAEDLVSLAMAAPGRLPAMMAQMAQGMANSRRTLAVHRATAGLSDDDALLVDAALAPEARQMTVEQLGNRARYLAMKLDPESADRRKQRGKRDTRVETWQEGSGNAALAGRELDPEVVLAANAYYDSIAKLLKRAGIPGSLRELRVLAFTDRNTGKDPLDRIPGYPNAGRTRPADERPGPGGEPAASPTGDTRRGSSDLADAAGTSSRDATSHDGAPAADSPPAGTPAASSPGEDGLRDDGWRDDEQWNSWDDEDESPNGGRESGNRGSGSGGTDGDGRRCGKRPAGPGGQGGSPSGGASPPFPADIHLLIPVGTLLGWSGAPGQASRLGFLGPRATRDLVQAASRHPRTRWQVTLVGPDGTAMAHGRARGQHPWQPASATGPPGSYAGLPGNGSWPPGRGLGRPDGGTGPPGDLAGGMTFSARAAQVADLLARLGVVFSPVAQGGCDHAGHEDRYVPSERLKGLIRARNATCPAPGCGARSVYSDLDHTTPWPSGPTDQCNLGPTRVR